MKNILFGAGALTVAGLLGGCGTYITPGPKADLNAIAPADIQAGFDEKPSMPFPASIVAVRVQGPGYANYQTSREGGVYGRGRYTVVLAHDVEEERQVEKLRVLPQVAGLISLNRMLLPGELDSERELRLGASRLHADLMFMYTFDTAFFDADAARPLTAISLGLAPTRHIRVTTTASGLLIDTRTGYIYSAYEETERQGTLSTSWQTREAADTVRLKAERRAFARLVDDVMKSWPQLLARYGAKK